MSALALQPHHLKNLPAPVATALTALFKMRLSDDVHQQAALEIMTGKPLDVALRAARAQTKRDLRPCAWKSLDDHEDGAPSFHEQVAAEMKLELADLPKSRWAKLDSASECLLDFLNRGTREIAVELGISQRRAQQLIKKMIDDINRGKQQGDLFGGGVNDGR